MKDLNRGCAIQVEYGQIDGPVTAAVGMTVQCPSGRYITEVWNYAWLDDFAGYRPIDAHALALIGALEGWS